mmetsp:Transcript_1786/g.6430  ORF Transcript_1786/g.6430 Transcript_1786/m.6430 type:complete len:361 (-) Transcript_1786:206-1288(-)
MLWVLGPPLYRVGSRSCSCVSVVLAHSSRAQLSPVRLLLMTYSSGAQTCGLRSFMPEKSNANASRRARPHVYENAHDAGHVCGVWAACGCGPGGAGVSWRRAVWRCCREGTQTPQPEPEARTAPVATGVAISEALLCALADRRALYGCSALARRCRKRNAPVAGDALRVGGQVGHARLPRLLLLDPLRVRLWLAWEALEADPLPDRRRVGRRDETEAGLALCAEDHALRLDAAQLLCAEVAQYDDARAADSLDRQVLRKTREDLTRPCRLAEVDGLNVELVAFRVRLGRGDDADADVEPRHIHRPRVSAPAPASASSAEPLHRRAEVCPATRQASEVGLAVWQRGEGWKRDKARRHHVAR